MATQILFLGLGYTDVAEESSLYTELVEELVALGSDVQVVAPAIDGARVGPRTEGGIPVLRVPAGQLFGTGLLQKGLNNLLLPLRFNRALKNLLGSWTPDWIISPTPPITFAPLVWWLKRRTKAGCYLILRDIFPQNAVDLGLMRKPGPTYLFFRLLEKWTYRLADQIGCMSPANKRFVLEHNPSIDEARLHILPNWIAERHIVGQADRSISREEWQVSDSQLLCVFGGNLGKPQQPEFLIDVAEALRNQPEIHIVIVGSGTESARVKGLLKARSLKNLTLKDRLPKDHYQRLLAAADVGIILLSQCFTIPNIPSRLLGYWAAGLPVLAATDPNTDLNEAYLRPFEAGLWVQMGDAAGFSDSLRWFAAHKDGAAAMGKRGQHAVIEKFTASKAAETVLDHISLRSK